MISRTKIMRLIFSAILGLFALAASARPPDMDTKLTKTIDRDFSLPKNGYVEVINKYGQVVINTWSKDSVKIGVKITAYGKDYNDAERMLDRVDIDFSKTNQYLTIETILDRKSGFFKEVWNNISDYSKTLLSKNKIEIDYEIYMPETAVLDLDNKFGDVYMYELNSKCDITVMHGNLRAGKFDHANIDVGYGDVRIKELNEGTLTLRGVEGDISKLGEVQLKSSSSSLTIKEADRVTLDSRSDQRLAFGQVNHLKGDGMFSKIEIQELQKTLDMDMTYGEVRVASIPFSFSKIDVESKYTDISLDFHPSTYLEVDITAREESLFLPNDNAHIEKRYTDDKQKYVRVTGKIGNKNNYPGYVYINSSGGDVSLSLSSLQQSVNK